MTPVPSARVAVFSGTAALIWWPIAAADPVTGAYVAGAALTIAGLLAVRDIRRHPHPGSRHGSGHATSTTDTTRGTR